MNMIKNHSGNESKSSRGQDEASLQKGKRENPGTGLVLVNKSFHPYIQVSLEGGSARVKPGMQFDNSLNETNFIMQLKGWGFYFIFFKFGERLCCVSSMRLSSRNWGDFLRLFLSVFCLIPSVFISVLVVIVTFSPVPCTCIFFFSWLYSHSTHTRISCQLSTSPVDVILQGCPSSCILFSSMPVILCSSSFVVSNLMSSSFSCGTVHGLLYNLIFFTTTSFLWSFSTIYDNYKSQLFKMVGNQVFFLNFNNKRFRISLNKVYSFCIEGQSRQHLEIFHWFFKEIRYFFCVCLRLYSISVNFTISHWLRGDSNSLSQCKRCEITNSWLEHRV